MSVLPPPSGMPITNYYNPGTQALRDLKAKTQGMFLGWIGWKAAHNYYTIHPDMADAVIYGMTALRRWWIWLFFFNIWLLDVAISAWIWYLNVHTIRGESYPDISGSMGAVVRNLILWIIPATLAITITWARAIDFALLKRRWLYRKVRPLMEKLEWCPNWVLYPIVFFPLCFPF